MKPRDEFWASIGARSLVALRRDVALAGVDFSWLRERLQNYTVRMTQRYPDMPFFQAGALVGIMGHPTVIRYNRLRTEYHEAKAENDRLYAVHMYRKANEHRDQYQSEKGTPQWMKQPAFWPSLKIYPAPPAPLEIRSVQPCAASLTLSTTKPTLDSSHV